MTGGLIHKLLPALVLAVLLAGCAEFPDRHAGGVAASTAGGVHTVRRGDTLYSIAWWHNLDYRSVARWNGISAPYTIYPGQRIRLSPPPGGATASAPKRRSPAEEEQKDDSGRSTRASEAPSQDTALSWQWPASGKLVRDFSKGRSGKRGIELAGEAGQAIRAAAAGRVVYSGNGLRGYGNLIIIKHNSRYLTAYGYNRNLLVEEGARVDAGEHIARMGLGPDNSPALHFELRRDGTPVDPSGVLPAR